MVYFKTSIWKKTWWRAYIHYTTFTQLSLFPFHILLPQPFHRTVFQFGKADWDGFQCFLADVPWSLVLSLGPDLAADELSQWINLGMEIYIPLTYLPAIAHRNHFLKKYHLSGTLDSKRLFHEARNRWMLSSNMQTLLLAPFQHSGLVPWTFGGLSIVYLTAISPPFLLSFMDPKFLLLLKIRQTFLLTTLYPTPHSMMRGIYFLPFHLVQPL